MSNIFTKFSKLSIDHPAKVITIALVISFVCSLLVSFVAINLKDLQTENKANEKIVNILKTAGIYNDKIPMEILFKEITPYVVDLTTGEFTNDVSTNIDERQLAKKHATSITLPSDINIIKVPSISRYKIVYVHKVDNEIKSIILPIKGYGIWSTLYGFVSINYRDGKFDQFKNINFYEHAETPGLGGEVDNPKWKNKWNNKIIYDSDGNYVFRVIKGQSNISSQVDGLSGATFTTRGVNNMIKFWFNENGFGPFLEKIKNGYLEDK